MLIYFLFASYTLFLNSCLNSRTCLLMNDNSDKAIVGFLRYYSGNFHLYDEFATGFVPFFYSLRPTRIFHICNCFSQKDNFLLFLKLHTCQIFHSLPRFSIWTKNLLVVFLLGIPENNISFRIVYCTYLFHNIRKLYALLVVYGLFAYYYTPQNRNVNKIFSYHHKF